MISKVQAYNTNQPNFTSKEFEFLISLLIH